MFEINTEHLNSILQDFVVEGELQSVVELQRYHYEKENPQSREVRLILKVILKDRLPIVVRLKNESDVTLNLIEEQCRFANLLRENNIETPFQNKCNGHFAKMYCINGYDVIVTVEQFADGEIHCVDKDIAEKTGSLLAKMHAISERARYQVCNAVLFDPLQDNDLFNAAEFQRYHEQLTQLDSRLYNQIITQYDFCRSQFSVFQNEPRYAVQGDISDCNLYKNEEGTIGVFDFNRCGNNNLYYDAIMQAVFESRLMSYPQDYAEHSATIVLKAFLTGYNRERPFTDAQKKVFPYLYAVINAFWSGELVWNDDSLRHAVESCDSDKIHACMQNINNKIHLMVEMPLES